MVEPLLWIGLSTPMVYYINLFNIPLQKNIYHFFLLKLIFFYFVAVADADPHNQNEISKEDTTPIAVVIPGLTSDSSSAVSLLSVL